MAPPIDLVKALVDEGLVPPRCAEFEVLIPASGVMQLRYTVNLRAEDMARLSRAYAAMAEMLTVGK